MTQLCADVMYLIASHINCPKTFRSFVQCNSMTAEIGKLLRTKKEGEFSTQRLLTYAWAYSLLLFPHEQLRYST